MTNPILSVKGLTLGYRIGKRDVFEAVRGASLDLVQGQVVGLSGESGSGKSTLAKAALGWRDRNAVILGGAVRWEGHDLLALPRKTLRSLWGRNLAYVPQDVASALNPSRRVYAQLDEALVLHTDYSAAARRQRIGSLLNRVGIQTDTLTLRRYPHEFSGGQQQRLALVLAMLCEPQVLVLDEPTTGIDASLRVDVLTVVRELLSDKKIGVLYISHDLAETTSIATDLAIMYSGEIVEYGSAREVFASPAHPYTAALRAAVPEIGGERMVVGIPGTPPNRVVRGQCSFSERCDFAQDICRSGPVELVAVGGNREVRCVRSGHIDLSGRMRRGELLRPRESGPHEALLRVSDLRCIYRLPRSAVRVAVSDISFTLHSGSTLGVVGESGSGKSTLLRAIAGLHPPERGKLVFDGRPLDGRVRNRAAIQHQLLQLVFQNPDRSLNPRHSVRRILVAPLRLYEPDVTKRVHDVRIAELLDSVQLPRKLLERFPHQLSGGEKQRVALARAFAGKPRLLLCDEVVSALDVSVQAGVMNLIRSYSKETGAAIIFVTHDLGAVRMVSDRIIVMRSGEICEEADTGTIFRAPRHPYTVELLAAVPRLEGDATAG
jgi:peptide/nickel transport system ATP-binding protein